MKKIRNVVMFTICLLCLGLLFGTANNNQGAYASALNDSEASTNFSEVEQVQTKNTDLEEANSSARAANMKTVSGSVKWFPSKLAQSAEPLKQIKVELMGVGLQADTLLATAYTDLNGNYNVSYNDPLLGEYVVYIRVYAESKTFRVVKDWFAIPTHFEYWVNAPFSDNIDERLNITIPYQEDNLYKAFTITQGMIFAQQYAVDVCGMETSKFVSFRYPTEFTSYSFDFVGGINANDYNNLDVLMHEYGHFVQNAMGTYSTSIFDVIFHDVMHDASEDHIYDKDNKRFAMELTYSESWASAFAMMGQKYFLSELSPWAASMKFRSAYKNYYPGKQSGEGQEDAVIAFLWDLFGVRNSNLYKDNWMPLGDEEFWQLGTQAGTYTLTDFVNILSLEYPQLLDKIGTRLSFFKIAPQILNITNSSLNTPKVSWRVNGSIYNPNNSFKIAFYDTNGILKYETENVAHSLVQDTLDPERRDYAIANYTLTQEEWTAALSNFANGEIIQISIKGYLSSTPVSGPYWSSTKTIISPNFVVDIIPETSDAIISGCVGQLTGEISLPSSIMKDNILYTITAIGDKVFENQTQITQITIPASITNIGNAAFKNCYNLASISSLSNVRNLGSEAFSGCKFLSNIFIPSGLTNIGEQAFTQCNSLNITVASSNPNYFAQGNILYNKNKTKLMFAGKVLSEVTVLDTVTQIAPYAFENNFNIYKIHFKNTAIIGNNAFSDCSNLNSAYFYSYETPTLGTNCFPQNSFTLYTPYISQSAYQQAFAAYTSNIDSIKINVLFKSNDITIAEMDVYYGSIIENIPQVVGYTVNGWYDNSGVLYENGNKWEATENLTLQVELVPIQYMITLDANGGMYNGANSFLVEYNSQFPNEEFLKSYIAPTKKGYTFEGWYDANGTKYMTTDGECTKLWDKVSDATLTARWAIKSYEIQINNDGTITWLGADGLSDEPCSIKYDSIINASHLNAVFKNSEQGYKEGHIFDHFEFNGAAVNWDKLFGIVENGTIIRVEPKWKKEKYNLRFIFRGYLLVKGIELEYDADISLDFGYRSVGRIFLGWSTEPSGGELINWTKVPDLTPGEQKDVRFYLYQQNEDIRYNVTYNLDGGINDPENPNYYTYYNPVVLKAPKKQGYTFRNWKNASTRYGGYQLNYDLGGNVTVTAIWQSIRYTINFHANNGTSGKESAIHEYNKTKNLINNPFIRSGYDFAGWATSPTGNVVYSNSQPVVNLSSDNGAQVNLYAKWVARKFSVTVSSLHIGDARSQTNDSYGTFEIVSATTITLLEDRVFRFNTQNPNPPFNMIQTSLSGVFVGMNVHYKNSSGAYVESNKYIKNGNTITFLAGSFSDNTEIYILAEYRDNCIAEGSLITLADGTQKAVEELTGGEQLLVWNLLTGTFDTAPILFIDSDAESVYEVINLGFSDGTSVKVISEHAFWDFDLNKYVFLRRDAAQYIGHWFNKQTTDADGNMTWTRVQLMSVDIQNEVTTAWSPVTYGHLCYYVNGMLSMPGATEGLINIFDVNPDTMKIDETAYNADIAEYGLFTYAEFAETVPIPEEIFDAFGGQYFKVAIGKGILTWDMITNLVERYAVFF